jgi:hypothetical protein
MRRAQAAQPAGAGAAAQPHAALQPALLAPARRGAAAARQEAEEEEEEEERSTDGGAGDASALCARARGRPRKGASSDNPCRVPHCATAQKVFCLYYRRVKCAPHARHAASGETNAGGSKQRSPRFSLAACGT